MVCGCIQGRRRLRITLSFLSSFQANLLSAALPMVFSLPQRIAEHGKSDWRTLRAVLERTTTTAFKCAVKDPFYVLLCKFLCAQLYHCILSCQGLQQNWLCWEDFLKKCMAFVEGHTYHQCTCLPNSLVRWSCLHLQNNKWTAPASSSSFIGRKYACHAWHEGSRYTRLHWLLRPSESKNVLMSLPWQTSWFWWQWGRKVSGNFIVLRLTVTGRQKRAWHSKSLKWQWYECCMMCPRVEIGSHVYLGLSFTESAGGSAR